MTYADLEAYIEDLLELAERNDEPGIKAKLQEIVPEYMPQDARAPLDSIFEVAADRADAGRYPQDQEKEAEQKAQDAGCIIGP